MEDALLGYELLLEFMGPLAPWFQDESVTDLMVIQGGRRVYVDREGALELVPVTMTEEDLLTIVSTIARSVGTEFDEVRPVVNAALPDGSRVAAMLNGISADGTTLTIRKFGRRYTLNQLVAAGTLTAGTATQLVELVRAQKNVLVSGGTGTGKTTFLNALAAAAIDHDDRIIVIEDTSEIYLTHPHQARFQAREELLPMGQEQALPPVTITQILKATLRHRPTRILLGEVRDAAAWDLLQLLNTGHGGSMSTLHANNAQDALYRLAELAQTAKLGLPLESTFFSIGRAIDVVVHVGRVGKLRCVTHVIIVDRYSPQDQAFTTHTLFDRQKEML